MSLIKELNTSMQVEVSRALLLSFCNLELMMSDLCLKRERLGVIKSDETPITHDIT
jgi:hypothetical protein